ncbi:DUF3798 domain-containing protein [Clostridiaceae bacterium Marseille-Q3526]|nr:DUF3798 domain-containing protein [Clostridiaceae bacterium Marseille-Q3526]
MRKKLVSAFLAAALAVTALTGCSSQTGADAESTGAAAGEETTAGETEAGETAEKEGEEAAADEDYKIGIVTPTVTVSEDEFRGAQEMVEKYPDLVVHKTIPENFSTDKEGCISVITSLADDPEMKYVIFDCGMEGIIPAFQTIREKRPDIVTMVTSNDDPKLLNEYVDISITTDWNRRGETIATKAHEMGAKTFIHYSFPTHMASESKVIRRDKMKETCEKLGMEFVEITTPDPQTGNGRAPMLQFLREDLPRQIEKYGPDTNIFGTNCPMYDVILDEAFKLKFIVAEQCCPTPTQSYPTILNLEITEDDLGNYDKINEMITEKSKEAGMTGRLSGWAMPSSVYIPKFKVELAKYMHDNNLKPEDVLSKEFLDDFSKEHMPVAADFAIAGEGLDNYYMLILEDIYY